MLPKAKGVSFLHFEAVERNSITDLEWDDRVASKREKKIDVFLKLQISSSVNFNSGSLKVHSFQSVLI